MVKRVIIFLAVILIVVAFILFQAERSVFAQRFVPKTVYICDHCQKSFSDKPHYVSKNSVDCTLCSNCYNDYLLGKWKLGTQS